MTDNEIINSLEIEINRADFVGYCDCVEVTVFENALNLIKRQKAEIERLSTMRTPKQPTTHDEEYYFCPYCKEELSVTGEDMYIYDITPPKYCCHCGQALDWSDET